MALSFPVIIRSASYSPRVSGAGGRDVSPPASSRLTARLERVRAASVYLTEGALSRLAYNYGITAGPSEPALITINLTDVHETRRVNP